MTRDAGARSSLLESGYTALARGAWEEARAAFASSLATSESPEALEGLGLAASWLEDAATMFEARERAYQLYHQRGERRGAGRVAMALAEDSLYFRGEPAVARAWLARARERLDGLDLTPEHGWLAIVSGDLAIMVDADSAAAREHAGQAATIGVRLGDQDLLMLARALDGMALVSSGRAREGMPRLDEVATAAFHGEVSNPLAVGICCCYLMAACERVRDLDRAAQWYDEIRRFCDQWRCHGLFALCRALYAGVLVWRGLWDEAEQELQSALRQLSQSRPVLQGEAVLRLAGLRRRQGRLQEAELLLQPMEGYPPALLERGALALDREDPDEAARCAGRFLRHVPAENHSEMIAGLELLVRAQIARDRSDAARETLTRLKATGGEGATGPVAAMVRSAEGAFALASGDHEGAVHAIEDAVEEFVSAGARFDAARTRIDLAKALRVAGGIAAAHRQALAARDALHELGAAHEERRAEALLKELERDGIGTVPRPGGLTPRELEVLRLLAEGLSNHEIAQRLVVSEFTIKRHVANILNKLDVPSRAAAVAYAGREHLL